MLGAVALMALGMFVAFVRPRRRVNRYLAAFILTFGMRNLIFWAVPLDDPLSKFTAATAAVGDLAGAILLLLFARELHRRWRVLKGREVALVLFVVAVHVAVGLAWSWSYATKDFDVMVAAFGGEHAARSTLTSAATFPVLLAAMYGLLMFLTLSHARARGDDDLVRRDALVLSVALLVYVGVVSGVGLPGNINVLSGRPVDERFFGTELATQVLVALVWLAEVARDPSPTARNVALLAVGAPLLGMLVFVADLQHWGVWGAARTLMVVFLAFAILRHQLLGMDVQVRWTLKQSTVAAIFIAVFFAVSEGAEEFFSSQVGPVLGIGAAAMLVFAIAPLQRFADRLAARAVPGAPDPASLGEDERLAFYRDQARLAWADGALSRDERRLLDFTRDRLGLTLEEAHALEREVSP